MCLIPIHSTVNSRLFQDKYHDLVSSPPVVHYVKRCRSFSLRAVFRALGGELVEYYEPPPAISNKKTLVLDLDGTLIYSASFPPHRDVSSFVIGTPEFHVFKRPGLDDFLTFVRTAFDVFVFTHGEEQYARPIIDHIMPWLDEEHRLYREACDRKGDPRKDLKILARSKQELILIDDSITAFQINPKNTIIVSSWAGTPKDRVLIDWLPGLLTQCNEADDVRPLIKAANSEMKVKADKSREIAIVL
jgi:Dullard-like phosphatase family protein